MEDQKDQIKFQKKETEAVSSYFDVHEFETVSESLAPPILQFKTDESQKEEETKKSEATQETFQYAFDGPLNGNATKESKVVAYNNHLGRGIEKQFKIPTIHKSASTKADSSQTVPPSFTLR